MQSIHQLITDIMKKQTLISCTLSNTRIKEGDDFSKTTIRPIVLKNELLYQFEYHYTKKVTHENLDEINTINRIYKLLEERFKQGQIFTTDADFQILISKKHKENILKKPPTKGKIDLNHNKKKKYIIPENIPSPFLIRLGVMNEKGKVLAQKYDKFRQINRFLEMVADIVPHIEDKKTINIIDFGSGKSYLTFALYHYLKDIINLNVHIIGLDLKKDVIDYCNEIVTDLGYQDLKFLTGNIEEYTGDEKVDMVVTLHACDTATDAALAKAIQWNADVILSVPCCQHELFKQLHNDVMIPMERHGILKERLSAIVTDAVRANILEIMGYSTQVVEFIDMEHTAKNLLIRAVNTGRIRTEAVEEYRRFKEFWQIKPHLEQILGTSFSDKISKI